MRNMDGKNAQHVALCWGLKCRQSMGKVVGEKCRIASGLHDAMAKATQQSPTNRALLERVALHRHLYSCVFEECSYTSIWSDVDQLEEVSGVGPHVNQWHGSVAWWRGGVVLSPSQRS
jgi:hypothetical protein